MTTCLVPILIFPVNSITALGCICFGLSLITFNGALFICQYSYGPAVLDYLAYVYVYLDQLGFLCLLCDIYSTSQQILVLCVCHLEFLVDISRYFYIGFNLHISGLPVVNVKVSLLSFAVYASMIWNMVFNFPLFKSLSLLLFLSSKHCLTGMFHNDVAVSNCMVCVAIYLAYQSMCFVDSPHL